MKLTARNRLFVGLTLFSMFFGAGNLIFPPYLGAQAGQSTIPAMVGFCLSAVCLPMLGVIAVAKSDGLPKLAGRVHPAFAWIFTLLIYLSIGPCLAIPRTATTSFEIAAVPFLPEGLSYPMAQAAYSVLFFAIALLVALKPDKLTDRLGKVTDGNTISDYDKEEIKRQFSISTTLIPLEYQGENGPIKINLLDTPGYFDFVGEVEEAISVADAAIIVVNCKAGIEPGTEKAWEMCEKYKLPRMIFVTNMDDDHASYRELVVKLETKFGRKIAPFQLPIRENEKFVGFVNVIKMGGRRFTHLSDYEEC